jgi:hypothetical protein
MSLILSGSDGLSDIDGTAATPAIRGTDTNTGIFFPAADTIAFAEGGAEAMRIDSDGDVGIGTTSPATKLHVNQTNDALPALLLQHGDGDFIVMEEGGGTDLFKFTRVAGTNDLQINNITANNLRFATDNTERMRIDSSGNVILQARTTGTGQLQVGNAAGTLPNGYAIFTANSDAPYPIAVKGLSVNQGMMGFFDTSNNVIGSVAKSSSAVSYNTSSDYRLKENIAPMTGALATVSALKPCTYTWKIDGSNGQGFIAHELAEVVPDCVTGEKDAVDAEGNIKPQGIDTSFLVATLTAAIQELKATVDAQAARIAALENPPVESATNE